MQILQIVFLPLLTSALVLGVPVPNSPDNDTALIIELRNAPTTAARTLLLANQGGNESFIFDFNNPPPEAIQTNSGGKFVSANIGTFPALTGASIAMNVGTVAPCGVVATHIHPRADEFVIVVEGRLIAQSITETGSVLITNELNAFTVTIFNQGAFHAQHNPDCTEAKFIASFNSNDPGATNIIPNYMLFNDDVALGGMGEGIGADITEETLRSIRIHMPLGNFAVQSCLEKCGLKAYGNKR